MKILKANAGALTNFEVLQFLQSRGAGKDPTRVIAPIAPSEFKVYDYLEKSAAGSQTMDCIKEFVEKAKKYDVAPAEILNIINIRPSALPVIHGLIEECQGRNKDDFVDELLELVEQVLPPPPNQVETEERMDQDTEENLDGQTEENPDGQTTEAS